MDIKPCPFCGNEKPVLMTRRGIDGWRDYFYVLCDFNDCGCGASGQWNHYADLAIEAWNRRATAPAVVWIVRCKQCKNYEMFKDGEGDVGFGWCNQYDICTMCEFFCASGERKEAEE